MKNRGYIALALLLLISVKSLLVPVIYLDFELHKEYIIKNLCENRFKPQLKCNGSCYLAKKMNKVAEDKATNETSNRSNFIKKVMDEIYDIKLSFSTNLFSKSNFKYFPLEFASKLTNGCYYSIFHPPIQ